MSNFLFSLRGPIRRVFFGSWQTQNEISVWLFLWKVNFIELFKNEFRNYCLFLEDFLISHVQLSAPENS